MIKLETGMRGHIGGTSSGVWAPIGAMGTLGERKTSLWDFDADNGTRYSIEDTEFVIGSFTPKVYDVVEITHHYSDPANRIKPGMVGVILDRPPFYNENTCEQIWFVCVPEMILQRTYGGNNGMYWLSETEFKRYVGSE